MRGLGRRQDRAQLERRQSADALEAVAHLLFLEGELRGVRDVLETTAAAAAEVRARRLDAIGRRRLDRLDDAARVPRPRFGQPDPQAIAGDPAAHEHDVPVETADALPAERQVVDGDTVHLADGTRVRYLGIDTPERKASDKDRFFVKLGGNAKTLREDLKIAKAWRAR